VNIVTGGRRELLTHSDVMTLLTGGVHKHKFPTEIDLTGKVSAVLRLVGGWGRSTQSATYPRLAVIVQADPTRTVDGGITAENADDRAIAALAAIDRHFHRTTREVVFWGTVRVLGSNRETEPTEVNRPNNLTSWWQQIYDVKVG